MCRSRDKTPDPDTNPDKTRTQFKRQNPVQVTRTQTRTQFKRQNPPDPDPDKKKKDYRVFTKSDKLFVEKRFLGNFFARIFHFWAYRTILNDIPTFLRKQNKRRLEVRESGGGGSKSNCEVDLVGRWVVEGGGTKSNRGQCVCVGGGGRWKEAHQNQIALAAQRADLESFRPIQTRERRGHAAGRTFWGGHTKKKRASHHTNHKPMVRGERPGI